MVNEEAVKQMGMQDPIGKWVSAWKKRGHIIGILKDYHTNTMREPIKPLIIDVKEYEYFGVIILRLEPGKRKKPFPVWRRYAMKLILITLLRSDFSIKSLIRCIVVNK